MTISTSPHRHYLTHCVTHYLTRPAHGRPRRHHFGATTKGASGADPRGAAP